MYLFSTPMFLFSINNDNNYNNHSSLRSRSLLSFRASTTDASRNLLVIFDNCVCVCVMNVSF